MKKIKKLNHPIGYIDNRDKKIILLKISEELYMVQDNVKFNPPENYMRR